jgi:orotidine-5'-phosphate decarboxylase
MNQSFGERLSERVRESGPLCAGIDPSREQLLAWGRDDDVTGLEFAALATLEAVTGVVGVIKPQVAFFERFGAAGFAVLERLLLEARSAGVLVIADAKRGDIGSTNDGYAQAWLADRSPLAVDAVTVHPYLGLGAMSSLLDAAGATGRGLFVVVATSNEEGRLVQAARTGTDERVEDRLLRTIAELNRASASPGSVGAVVGATRDRPEFDLANLAGPILCPGVGAQGATAEDVGQLFGRCPKNSVIVNVARALASTGPDRRAVRDAASRWRDDLLAVLA